MSKAGDLPYRLYEWATKEMQFRPTPSCPRMPTIENFRILTTGGNNAKVWKYVVENVASTKKLSKIRGNLNLYEEQDQLAAFNEENEKKRKKIEKLKQEIKHLETDVKQLQEEIFVSDATLSDANAKLFNLKKKTVLLSQFSAQSKKQMSIFNCLSQQISKHLTDSENLFDKETSIYYCLNSSTKIETSCQKSVRESIEKIYNGLTYMHRNNQTLLNRQSDNMEQLKRNWQKTVESTIEKFSVNNIMETLINMTNAASYNLNQKTTELDFEQELSKLMKKYEDQTSNSQNSNQILQQDVYQLISERQKSHITNHINTKNLLIQNKKDKLQLEDMQKVANALLEEILADDPQKLSMAKDLVQEETRITGLDGSMCCLEKEICRLKQELLKGDGEKKILEKKYERIENFEMLMQKRTDLIQDLHQDFYTSRNDLNNSHIQMVSFVEEKLGPHKESIQNFEGNLKNVITDEVTKFLDVSLPHLMTVDIDGCRVPRTDLSINQLNPDFVLNSKNSLREILTAIDFPMFKAPEHILAHICQLKIDIMKNQLVQKLATSQTQKQSDSGNEVEIIEKLGELFEMLNKSEHEIQTKLHQNLQQDLKNVLSDIDSLGMLKHRLEEWETQPAQHAVQWVKVNGLTFDQWMERWKVAVAQLRQYQVADLC